MAAGARRDTLGEHVYRGVLLARLSPGNGRCGSRKPSAGAILLHVPGLQLAPHQHLPLRRVEQLRRGEEGAPRDGATRLAALDVLPAASVSVRVAVSDALVRRALARVAELFHRQVRGLE